eukprot:2039731-Pyramimonas_sp.AAC.1
MYHSSGLAPFPLTHNSAKITVGKVLGMGVPASFLCRRESPRHENRILWRPVFVGGWFMQPLLGGPPSGVPSQVEAKHDTILHQAYGPTTPCRVSLITTSVTCPQLLWNEGLAGKALFARPTSPRLDPTSQRLATFCVLGFPMQFRYPRTRFREISGVGEGNPRSWLCLGS